MPEKLSLTVVRAACGSRVLARAEEILDSPLLFARTRCGETPDWELFARCHGSQGEVYDLRARIEGAKIGESACSCPYDGNGLCKHRVALLLAQIHAPTSFTERPALEKMVDDYAAENLRELVLTMVRREPKFLPLLDAARGDESDARGAVERAFSGRDASDGAPVLERGFKNAAQKEKTGDWFGAGEWYRLVLEAIVKAAPRWETANQAAMEWGEDGFDEDWDFGDKWVFEAVAGLERAFQIETLAPAARRDWLASLWETDKAMAHLDYLEMPKAARDLLVAYAPDDLWNEIEAEIRAQLGQTPRQAGFVGFQHARGVVFQHVAAGDDWKRQELVDFLTARLEKRGRKAEIEVLLAELGTTSQQFDLKLKNRDFAGAAKLASEFYGDSSSELLPRATQLDEAGAQDLAIELVLNVQKRRSDFLLVEWLADWYLRAENGVEAQRYATILFAGQASEENFGRLKRAVELTGDWESQYEAVENEVKAKAGKDIWGDRAPDVALKMAIFDAKPARILDRFALIPKQKRAHWLDMIATSCEAEMPENALKLWRELAEWTIENRNPDGARKSYQLAAQALKRARAMHKKLGTMGEWIDYIHTLREVYSKLRALQDELKKAGL